MIPMELYDAWEDRQEREELLFLADHGGGWPDCLIKPTGLSSEDRLRILQKMGFRVSEQYEMPGADWEGLEPWARLTNGVSVNLTDGFTVRRSTRRKRDNGPKANHYSPVPSK